MKKGVLLAAGLLALTVFLAGCIGGTSRQHTSSLTSSVPYENSSTSPVAPVLILPTKVSFNATLTILVGNMTLVKYSYTGTVDYKKSAADVTKRYVYHPDDPRLTGNWHLRRIVVVNGSRVKIFIVPPAEWVDVPPNESSEIIHEVLYANPYSSLERYVLGNTTCNNCSMSLHLTPGESQMLLKSLMLDSHAPLLGLKGKLLVRNGEEIHVMLTGTSKDGTIYKFEMEVKKL